MPKGTVTIPIDDYLDLLNKAKLLDSVKEEKCKKGLDDEPTEEQLEEADIKCRKCRWTDGPPEGVEVEGPGDPCVNCFLAAHYEPKEEHE